MNGPAENQKKSRCAPAVNPHIGTEKKCSRCKKLKIVSAFYRDNYNKDGLMHRCKECERDDFRDRYRANPEKHNKRKKDHPEKNSEYQRKWARNNPDKVVRARNKSNKKRRETPRGKLRTNFSTSIYKALRSNKGRKNWEALVGYTLDKLKIHLEKQFKPGMSWENYGEWHLDHIVPISAFNFEKPEDDDFKRCWALKNLQPLWASDNLKKQAKITKPFQPRLIFY